MLEVVSTSWLRCMCVLCTTDEKRMSSNATYANRKFAETNDNPIYRCVNYTIELSNLTGCLMGKRGWWIDRVYDLLEFSFQLKVAGERGWRTPHRWPKPVGSTLEGFYPPLKFTLFVAAMLIDVM